MNLGLGLRLGGGLSGPLPSLALSFLGTSLDPRITFTRASSATRFNSSGVLELVGTDVPRFDFDPVTLQPRGLLIEEQRTNLLLWSEDFTTSWVPTRATVSANAAVAPSGTTTADRLVEDSSNNSHFVNQGVASVAANATVATSIFAKADGRNFLAFVTQNQGGSFLTSYFNLSNGTIGTVAAGHTASIQSFGNGWFRCTIVTTQTAVTGSFNFYPGPAAVDGSTIYQGNGTSGILLWGAQMEIGNFATSYIPTTSATVTRAADVATMTGTNFSAWYNQAAGTFVFEGSTFGNVAGKFPGLVTVNDGTVTNRVGGYVAQNASTVLTQSNIAGIGRSTATVNTVTSGVPFKSAHAYQSGEIAIALNGGTVATNTNSGVPAVNQFQLGRFDDVLNGHIRSIRYFPTRLPNAQLQALTT